MVITTVKHDYNKRDYNESTLIANLYLFLYEKKKITKIVLDVQYNEVCYNELGWVFFFAGHGDSLQPCFTCIRLNEI